MQPRYLTWFYKNPFRFHWLNIANRSNVIGRRLAAMISNPCRVFVKNHSPEINQLIGGTEKSVNTDFAASSKMTIGLVLTENLEAEFWSGIYFRKKTLINPLLFWLGLMCTVQKQNKQVKQNCKFLFCFYSYHENVYISNNFLIFLFFLINTLCLKNHNFKY